MTTILVTGANRGIGLEFVRQYTNGSAEVHACCRDPETASTLQGLASHAAGRVHVHRLDVTDPEALSALARELRDVTIDILLQVAGVFGPSPARQSLDQMDYAAWADAFAVNAMAPLRGVQAFREHVARSDRGRIVTLTSGLGSITNNHNGWALAYRSSKAAANQVVRGIAPDLAEQGIVAVAMHPGWVRTAMGGPDAHLSPAESVQGMREVIEGLTAEHAGRFLRYTGEELPW